MIDPLSGRLIGPRRGRIRGGGAEYLSIISSPLFNLSRIFGHLDISVLPSSAGLHYKSTYSKFQSHLSTWLEFQIKTHACMRNGFSN